MLRDNLRRRTRAAIEARDLELINANADRLNAEAADALTYQVIDPGEPDPQEIEE